MGPYGKNGCYKVPACTIAVLWSWAAGANFRFRFWSAHLGSFFFGGVGSFFDWGILQASLSQTKQKQVLGGGFKYFLTPSGNDLIWLVHIFQRGWNPTTTNHQSYHETRSKIVSTYRFDRRSCKNLIPLRGRFVDMSEIREPPKKQTTITFLLRINNF